MVNDLLPSMFHRRLLLLSVLLAAGSVVPLVQLGRLTMVQGKELREKAESRLQSQRYIPTSRGRILDRKGRILAIDRPSYDIAIDYPVISGQWAFAKAAAQARQIHKAQWGELNPVEREALVQEQLPQFQAALAEGWATLARLGDVPMEDLEERRNEIIASVHRAQANLQENKRQQLERIRREEAIERGQEIAVEVSSGDVNVRIREQAIPHVMIRGVSDDAAFKFIAMAEGDPKAGPIIPGLHVLDAAGRDYPSDVLSVTIDRSKFPGPLRTKEPAIMPVSGVATHVIGWMRSTVFPEDLESRAQKQIDRPSRMIDDKLDLGFYMAGDSVGSSGIERSAEQTLRGLRGVETEQLDTGEVIREAHKPGQDVTLTLDINLQARVQALLDPRMGLAVVQNWHGSKTKVPNPRPTGPDDAMVIISPGTPLSGAAVVLDIDTGEILALVSSPSFTREDIAEHAERVYDDPVNAPFRNRAIGEAYPPGSIIKPLMYASAVSAGIVDPNIHIACNGFLYPEHPKQLQCWSWKQFQFTHASQFGAELSASDALMVSCNIFFYTIGRSLGPDRIVDWCNHFGIGRSSQDGTDILHPALGIGPQYDGAAGDPKGKADTTLSEATLMGIGQGPVAWTPLHAVDAYSTLARGGLRILPHIRVDTTATMVDLHLDRRAIPILLDGLHRAVSDERGSGHHITWVDDAGLQKREEIFSPPPGLRVWGKSGTADAPKTFAPRAPARPVDDDDDEANLPDVAAKPKLLRSGDHSWFVGMVGASDAAGEPRPRYAIAVVVEYGGSGGKVSGPIANQIIYALMAEGYLGDHSAAPDVAPPTAKDPS